MKNIKTTVKTERGEFTIEFIDDGNHEGILISSGCKDIARIDIPKDTKEECAVYSWNGKDEDFSSKQAFTVPLTAKESGYILSLYDDVQMNAETTMGKPLSEEDALIVAYRMASKYDYSDYNDFMQGLMEEVEKGDE